MANRYGRRQRRRHLDRIAAMEAALQAGPKELSMRAIVAGRVVMLDWKYALSEKVLREGMTEAEIIHIAEQVAVQFYHRMKRELYGGKSEG